MPQHPAQPDSAEDLAPVPGRVVPGPLPVPKQSVPQSLVGPWLGKTWGPTEANPCVNQIGDLHMCVEHEVSLKSATTASNRKFSEECHEDEDGDMVRTFWGGEAVNPVEY